MVSFILHNQGCLWDVVQHIKVVASTVQSKLCLFFKGIACVTCIKKQMEFQKIFAYKNWQGTLAIMIEFIPPASFPIDLREAVR